MAIRQHQTSPLELATWPAISILLLVMLFSGIANGATSCNYCGKIIGGSYIEFEGRSYHTNCYQGHVAPRCEICKRSLDEQWVVQDGKNYHERCYNSEAALRCSHCGEIINGKYLLDYWGNGYHAYHQEDVDVCSFCGRLFSDPVAEGGQAFGETHQVCLRCNRGSISSEAEGRKLLGQLKTDLEKSGIVIGDDDIEFALVSQRELGQMIGHENSNQFGLTRFEESHLLGLLTDREFSIYVLRGLPRMHFIMTATHELMHVWQYLNTPEIGEPALVEGSCNFASTLVLRQFDGEQTSYVIEQLKRDPDPIYGGGYRRVKKLVENRGVDYWLQHLRFDPEFPIGY